jgi:hypothetical protein
VEIFVEKKLKLMGFLIKKFKITQIINPILCLDLEEAKIQGKKKYNNHRLKLCKQPIKLKDQYNKNRQSIDFQ